MSENEVITGGQAWEVLGAHPAYAPKRPAKPASGAQLFACNLAGLLELRPPADDGPTPEDGGARE